MQPIPYLFFKNTCEQAMRAYSRVFGAPEPEIMYVRDAPEGGGMGNPDGVMHSALQIGTGWIYASDFAEAGPDAGCVALVQPTAAETHRLFKALAEGGQVQMPPSATSWSPAFAMVTDRWGTRWMLDTESAGADAGAHPEAVA